MSTLLNFIMLVAFTCIMLLLGPWCVIWAINTLVAAGGVTTFVIPFTFWTWLSAAVIGGLAVLPSARRS